MNRVLFLIVFIVVLNASSYSQTGGVTIGANTSPDSSAVLDLQSVNKGFLPPRLTTKQRNSIPTPAAGLIVFDTNEKLLYMFDGEEWLALTTSPKTKSNAKAASGTQGSPLTPASASRVVPAGCLTSLLPNLTYIRPGSTATSIDTSGSMIVYAPNEIRTLYDLSTGQDLGYAVEDNDSTLLYQSDNLLDLNSYNNTQWNAWGVTTTLNGLLANRPRFLITKNDNLTYSSHRKLGLKMNYQAPYLVGILVQKSNCNSFRIVFRSEGAGTESSIALDLNTGNITTNSSAAGAFSNTRAIALKNADGAWLFILTFTPNSQPAVNTSHQLRFVPNSGNPGDAVYVASPFVIATEKIWQTHIVSSDTATKREKEFLKAELGLQSTGAVLVKAYANNRDDKNRAISWQESTGTGLSLTGAGYTGGYAMAENGTLLESAGKFTTSNTIQPGSQTYYIDGGGGNGGKGTLASPYNSFSQLPSLSGNLGGAQILIKRGTRVRQQLVLTGCSNFILDAYGTGALPIVDGSDVIRTRWTAEGSVWYLSSQTKGQSVFVNDKRLIAVRLKTQMSATANTSWFDAANSRIYINPGSGVNPNNAVIEITTRTYAVRLAGCSNFNVRNLQFQRARNSGLTIDGQGQTSKNSVVERCIATYNGAFDATGNLAGDGIIWYGTNSSGKGSGNIVRQCVSTYNINVGYEFCFQDSLTLEDCYASRNGQGIELWGFVTNSAIRRNKIFNTIPVGVSWGHGNALWIPNSTIQSPITGGQNNLKVYANVFATTWQETLDIQAGAVEFTNNLFFDPTRSREDYNGRFVFAGKLGGANAVSVSFRNNIFYQPPYQGYPVAAFTFDNTVSNATLDYNYYYSDPSIGGYTPYNYLGTGYGGNFAAYQSGTGQDANGASQADPKFTSVTGKTVTDVYQTFFNGSTRNTLLITDEAVTDFRLSAASPCIGKGDAAATGSVGTDFVPFGTSRAVGPYSRLSGNPISFGDAWLSGYSFRGGSLYDVQANSTTLTDNAAVIQLSVCR